MFGLLILCKALCLSMNTRTVGSLLFSCGKLLIAIHMAKSSVRWKEVSPAFSTSVDVSRAGVLISIPGLPILKVASVQRSDVPGSIAMANLACFHIRYVREPLRSTVRYILLGCLLL